MEQLNGFLKQQHGLFSLKQPFTEDAVSPDRSEKLNFLIPKTSQLHMKEPGQMLNMAGLHRSYDENSLFGVVFSTTKCFAYFQPCSLTGPDRSFGRS